MITTNTVTVDEPNKHTQSPIVNGTSVLAIKFNGGVMLAADTLGSYGSLARFRDIRRLKSVNSSTVVGASGEFSDFQYISELLDRMTTRDFCIDDGVQKSPREIHRYLTRVLYNRRSKLDPLWNAVVVGGVRNGEPFLGLCDLVGTSFEENVLATGLGSYMALPLLRKQHARFKGNMSRTNAKNALEEAMRVLIYRDGRTINKIQTATITEAGIEISDPYELETQWQFKGF